MQFAYRTWGETKGRIALEGIFRLQKDSPAMLREKCREAGIPLLILEYDLSDPRIVTHEGMISQIVEVGSNNAPYGFVWLYCGVSQADKGPVYLYELRLSFVP